MKTICKNEKNTRVFVCYSTEFDGLNNYVFSKQYYQYFNLESVCQIETTVQIITFWS